MNNELKPCPFCGENVMIVTRHRIDSEGYEDSTTYVDCENHSLVIWLDDWNNRPIENALKAELDALKASLDTVLTGIEDITKNLNWEINGSGELIWVGDDDLIDWGIKSSKQIRAALDVKSC